MQKHYNSIEWYFENKKDYHRDIVVHVPLNKFRELFDEGDEIPKRLDSIRKQPGWQNITAEQAEIESGGSDAFFLHKAAILADSINTNGLLAPVHAHWHSKKGQMRHPSNDKASVISSGIVKTCNCEQLTVPVLWRDCVFHHDLFPDHNYTNWFEKFVITEIDTPEKYISMYGDAIYDSELVFESSSMQNIWNNYPAIWGKFKPMYFCYENAFDKIRGYAGAENCVYCGVFDKYHRLKMQGNHIRLGDIYQIATDGIVMGTNTVERCFSWQEMTG